MLVVEPSIFDVLWCSQRGECGVGWIEDRYGNVFKPKAPQYNRNGGSRIVWKCKMSLWTQFGDLETGGAHLCNLLSFSSKFPADKKPSSLWRKILQWKQIRDQKLNLGSTMGSFSTPNSLSQHHFLCFSAKRGRADPFPNYLTKIKEVRPIIFQDLIEWIDTIQKYEIFPFNFQRLEGFWPIFHFIKRVSFQLSPIQSNSAAAYSFQFHQSWSHATPPTLIHPLWITPKSVRLFTNSNFHISTKSMRSKTTAG